MDTLLQGLRAAAEPTRLRILALCDHADLSVSELVDILGQSQPRVSRHLKLLVEAGLLERNPEGTKIFFHRAESGPCAELCRMLVDMLPLDDATLAGDLDRLSDIKAQRLEKAEAYFRDNAGNWEDLRGLYVDDHEIDDRMRELVLSEQVEDLLDIGTGTGRVLELVGASVRSAVGIDNSRAMLDIARANLGKADLRNCQVRLADMYRLPFSDQSFDVVTVHMSMRYAEQPGAALAEARRVLRPGGRVILVDFAPHDLRELQDDHQHRWLGFSRTEMAEFMGKAGLRVEDPQVLNGEPLSVCLWTGRAPDIANDSVQAGA